MKPHRACRCRWTSSAPSCCASPGHPSTCPAVDDVPCSRPSRWRAGGVVGAERLIDTLWPDEPAGRTRSRRSTTTSRGCVDTSGRPRTGCVVPAAGTPSTWTARTSTPTARVSWPPSSKGATPDEVARLAREALDLWRGDALRGVPRRPAAGERGRRPRRAPAAAARRPHRGPRLARGRSGGGRGDLRRRPPQPLRERSVLLLMRALAAEGRSGRRDGRRCRLPARPRRGDRTGPGPPLAALEQEIANHEHPTGSPAPPTLFTTRQLARPSGPLVGRRQDREEILRLLADHRVVTVTGPGGVGKTRLALDLAAEEFLGSDGGGRSSRVVDLVRGRGSEPRLPVGGLAARAPDRRPTSRRATSRLPSGRAGCSSCWTTVSTSREACRQLVATLDAQAPHVRVLATSRVTLHAPGEYVVRLQPLPVPGTTTDLAHAERQASVRAFVEHARRRRNELPLQPEDVAPLVEVLRHLDGLPLAIELVAGQAAMMPISAVRDRLGRALDLHTGVAGPEDDRQRTLRGTIAWSYALLDDAERALLRSIAPFPGGVDLGGVETLAADAVPGQDPLPLLQRLVDASLVVVDPSLTRYRLLFTVRAFLLDELAARGELLEAPRSASSTWAVRDRAPSSAPRCSVTGRGGRRPAAACGARQPARRPRPRADGATNWTPAWTSRWRRPGLDLARPARAVGLVPRAGRRARDRRAPPRGRRRSSEAADVARLTGDFDLCVALAERALRTETSSAGRPAGRRAAGPRWRRSRTSVATSCGPPAVGQGGEVPRTPSARSATWPRPRSPPGTAVTSPEPVILHRPGLGTPMPSARVRVRGPSPDTSRARSSPCDDPAARSRLHRRHRGARSVGANFVEGVASVALASARTRTGDHVGAAELFGHLLGYWSATGHQPQLWTTARNAVPLLVCARPHPGGRAAPAARGPPPSGGGRHKQIARHSGRSFTSVDDLARAGGSSAASGGGDADPGRGHRAGPAALVRITTTRDPARASRRGAGQCAG